MTTTNKPEASPNHEESISALENSVDKLESGDLSLEESLQLFETSVKQTREAQRVLAKAEQRVQTLMDAGEVPVIGSLTEPGAGE
jgi:exodeoxyribonuclease VII small subunit